MKLASYAASAIGAILAFLLLEDNRTWGLVVAAFSVLSVLLAVRADLMSNRLQKQKEQELTKAQQDLGEVYRTIGSRVLSGKQRSDLISRLDDPRLRGAVIEITKASGQETADFANSLRDALIASGMNVGPVTGSFTVIHTYTDPDWGQINYVRTESALRLAKILNEVFPKFRLKEISEFKTDGFVNPEVEEETKWRKWLSISITTKGQSTLR
ncbi:hypothetical protein [Falsirhodobacter sp. 20TX0035]|uniref:hypothetical protein n=1 Tax=Falsirhodobacter sp. 20TX0035 TaxID=3022019 RepID=UPI00232D8B4F|nr:hypothetical protein [Falsirhodobacter sp. 20TX0035]MDB6455040.1 hypothetical protein [Falsirhodobacter sp. 20TX0035]